MKTIGKLMVVLLVFGGVTACKKNKTIDPGNDPNFTIVPNNDGELKKYNRKVVVFDIPIYAAPKVEDSKLLHAANVMAQYLDNDEDGVVDNQLVVDKLIEKKAYLFMWKSKLDRISSPPSNWEGQDLGNAETIPGFVSGGKTGRFDASLEEVLHLITHVGYANVYPEVFGESAGTSISDAMDIARGGSYDKIPDSYPSEAWYTYTDKTCKYDCQVTEYHYWALTSILGAQENRLSEIEQEWKLNTKEKVETTDPAVYALLTNPEYKFPTVLPDGSYRH